MSTYTTARGAGLTPDTPVSSLEECFNYLQNNAWQFKMLEPDSPVRISAQMLRSLYYHIGCARFGVPFNDDIDALARDLGLRIAAQRGLPP